MKGVLQRKIHPAAENFVVNIFSKSYQCFFVFVSTTNHISRNGFIGWLGTYQPFNKTKTLIVDHFDLTIYAMVLLSKQQSNASFHFH